MIKIRTASLDDINGIMGVEKATFEPVGEKAMASPNMMLMRVALCNYYYPGWFYVAEYMNKIVGTMVLQPTEINPDDCTSWEMATDNGTLIKTFNSNGQNIYGVSLGVLESAPSGTVELLIHRLLSVWLYTRKKYFFICSRMPGYLEANNKNGISPEDYWQLKNSEGKSYDWMLRFFEDSIGVKPRKLLVNGFLADEQSVGHGVLCVNDNPLATLNSIVAKIYNNAFHFGFDECKADKLPNESLK